MSTIFVDNIKTVSGTDTFKDGQFGGTVNSSATLSSGLTFAGTTTGVTTPSTLGTPTGTTAQRPSSPSLGHIRYNSDFNKFEHYNGIGWLNESNSYNPEQGGLVFEVDAKHPDSFNSTHDTGSMTVWKNLRGSHWRAISESGPPAFNSSGRYFDFPNAADRFTIRDDTSEHFIDDYPFSVVIWAWSDPWYGSGFDELFNMSINGTRVSVGVSDNWTSGGEPMIMYGGAGHWGAGYNSTYFTGGIWHCYVWIVHASNSSDTKFYLDNANYTLTNRGGAHGGTAGWRIGNNTAGSEGWPGRIAYVAMYNCTLSATQVSNIYNAMSPMYA